MKMPSVIAMILLALGTAAFGEQIAMKNGDRYMGTVLAMTADKVVVQSELLGKITLPRAQVASITLAPAPVTTAPAAKPSAIPTPSTNHPTAASITVTGTNDNQISAALQGLGANTNFINDVRKQFLAGAGPEANGKFDSMVAGLFDGSFNMNSLRAQAKTAADQIRELKKQGVDVGDSLDGYLTILDSFLKETENTS